MVARDCASAVDGGSSKASDYRREYQEVRDIGRLHKFTGVFVGTPAAAGGGFPAPVSNFSTSSGNLLSSPVVDASAATPVVYVGSNCAANTTNCNRLHWVNSSTGAVTSSGQIGSSTTNGTFGVKDAPIVDPTAGKVYAFLGRDLANDENAVVQFATSFATNNLGTSVSVGTSGTGSQVSRGINSGMFDDAYFTSTPASPTGSLYVCGSSSGSSRTPTLWKVPISLNVMAAPIAGPTLGNPSQITSSTAEGCSPITTFKNGTSEYLYVGLDAPGILVNGCTTGNTGCIYNYNLAGPWNTSKAAAAALNAPGGTGGIIIDNTLTGGGSQVYYALKATATTPGLAVQASQAALQ